VSDARGTPAEPEVHAWEAGDAPVADAFAGTPAAALGTRAEAWAWAFRGNPAGTRLVVARRAGTVRAVSGALPVRTRVLGTPRTFAEMLPVPVPADEEGAAALRAAAAALAEAYGGGDGDLVHYGFPEARALAFGQRHLGHELLRVACLFVRALADEPRELAALVREPARFGPEADELYACCATHWNASAIRDAAFLNWRFHEHPLHRYRVLALVTGETLRGYAVYRTGRELGAGLGLLVDWLVLPGDDQASESLLASVLACARADGAGAVAVSIPEWSPWAQFFQARGFRHRPTEHLEVVRSFVPRFDMLWLRDNWWTTLADALLV
jgi:hypothetical protein